MKIIQAERGRTRMFQTVTLEDVAKAAGVGKGTVDRVLHNRGRVAEETRERVLACVKRLNYRPNVAARMLAQSRKYRVAVCFHNKETEFWNQVLDGVRRAAEEYEPLGVAVETIILPHISEQLELEAVERVLSEKFDGLAIVPYSSDKLCAAINRVVDAGIPVVTFNNHEKDVRAEYVGMDGLQSGRTAGRLMSMIAPANSRYLIVSTHSSMMMEIDERAMGFREAFDAARKDAFCVGSIAFEEDYDVVRQFLYANLKTLGVNVIYATTECVTAVGRALSELGMTRDVWVIGHDLTPTAVKYLHTGDIDIAIGQDPEQQGYLSVAKICRCLLLGEAITSHDTGIRIAIAENTPEESA